MQPLATMDHDPVLTLRELVEEHASASRLHQLEPENAARLRALYPGLPEDYLQTLLVVGYGNFGPNAFTLYGGPMQPDEIFDAETARELEGILFVGDDMAGWMYGYQTSTTPWRVREFDHQRMHPMDHLRQNPGFAQFIAAELRRALGMPNIWADPKSAATLHIEFADEYVYCVFDGKGWGAFSRVLPGGSAHDWSYEQLRRLGPGSHAVEVDTRVPSIEISAPSRGTEQDEVDSLRFWLFVTRCGLALPVEVLFRVVSVFNRRTAQEILTFLPLEYIEEVRQFAAGIPRTRVMRMLRPKVWWSAHGGGKWKVPEENLVALRAHFVDRGKKSRNR